MSNSIISRIVADGQKSVMMKVIGTLEHDQEPMNVTDLAKLAGHPDYLRLDTIKFAVEDKMAVLLWWEGEGEESLICPLAGRGLFDFEWFGGEHNSKFDGHGPNLQVSAVIPEALNCGETKHFALWLDFTKVKKS